MRDTKRQTRFLFPLLIAKECPDRRPYEVAKWCDQAIRMSIGLHRFAVEACNRELSDSEHRRWNTLERKAYKHCHAMGFEAVIGGDPRGCVFKVSVPSGQSWNDIDMKSICVPVE